MRLVVLLAAVITVSRAAVTDRYHPDDGQRDQVRTPSRTPAAERDHEYWKDEAEAGIKERLRRRDNRNVAKNIVMFLGDGMSVPTQAAARALLGQRRGQPGEEAQLSFEAFPSSGFSKTYCLNRQVADSACSATAYLCGVKANWGTIGVNGHVPRWDCDASLDTSTHVDSIAAWALKDGRDAGVVTTTRITHASPAGTYAHVANRQWERDVASQHWERPPGVPRAAADPARCHDIAHQLVHMSPGNQFKVILGGGRRELLPVNITDEEGSPGLREDNRNLIEEWLQIKQSQGVSHAYVWNRDQLMSHMTSPPDYLLGLFESNHMQYHLEADKTKEPTLAEMTEIAIKSLSRNEKGFFLFIESGRIDTAHHDNFVHLALDETIQMSEAVKVATELLSEEDSLIVVTSDHSHVMAYNGYSDRGNDILGVTGEVDDHNMPYMTLSYTNGPGWREHFNGTRTNITAEQNFQGLRWQTHVDVPLFEDTHGGDDVGVFARGPHHDLFTGVYEQSQIPHLMAYAGCFGPGLTACNAGPVTHVPIFLLVLVSTFQLLRS